MTPPRFTIVKEPSKPLKNIEKPRILIAEDDAIIRHKLVKCLNNYEIIEAEDGEEAYQLALEKQPDVMLVDWMMPKRNGLQLTRILRSDPVMKLTPIILLTGRNDEASTLEALEAGVNDFVTKPCSSLELQYRIGNMITISNAQKEVTESRELLMRSEKLSSLGELSAGIMHEINNPLNYAITGLHALKVLEGDLNNEFREEFNEVVRDINEGLTRVSQITKDLREFSRMGRVQMKRVNLAKVVKMTERLVSDRLLKVQYDSFVPEDLYVYASEGQVSQVLVNLLINSVDALEETLHNPADKIIRLTAERRAEGICLTVWDNGCGISEEKKTRLFDPFYTTKPVGKGTGLGLSVCKQMLQAHGADLCVDSGEGQYTRFYTVLPEAGVNCPDTTTEGREIRALVSSSLY